MYIERANRVELRIQHILGYFSGEFFGGQLRWSVLRTKTEYSLLIGKIEIWKQYGWHSDSASVNYLCTLL